MGTASPAWRGTTPSWQPLLPPSWRRSKTRATTYPSKDYRAVCIKGTTILYFWSDTFLYVLKLRIKRKYMLESLRAERLSCHKKTCSTARSVVCTHSKIVKHFPEFTRKGLMYFTLWFDFTYLIFIFCLYFVLLPRIMFDGANGVGAPVMKEFVKYLGSALGTLS